MKKSDIEKRTEEIVLKVLASGTVPEEIELWDVEYVKEGSDYYLRIYIDKEGGVTIDDCVAVTRAVEPQIDEEDYVEEAYILEVSSPGLTRKLKKDKDYEKSIGKLVKLKLYKAVEGGKEFTGRLKEFDEEKIVITLDDDTDIKAFERSNISSARLEYEEI